jgi:hypothetical protein
MIFYKHILTITFLATSLSGVSQSKTRFDSIAAIKTVLQKDNIIATRGVGYASMPSRHWYSFAYLLSVSTDEELLQLTYDSTPAVRLYSYIALTHSKYSEIKLVKDRLSNDTSELSTFEGCIFGTTTVSNGISTISNWYNEKSTTAIVTSIQNDPAYRRQLFSDIIHKKKIRSPPRHFLSFRTS